MRRLLILIPALLPWACGTIPPPTTPPAAMDTSHPPLIFVSEQEIRDASERIAAKEAGLLPILAELRAKAYEGLALAIPQSYAYDQKSADVFGRAGLFMAVVYRLTGEPEYRNQAKKILLGMARGFTEDNPYVLKNFSLDFSVSLPSYIHIYELLYADLTRGERNQVAAALSLAGDLIKGNAYGGPNDPKADTPLSKKQHSESNIRSFHNTAAYLVGMAVKREDLKEWAVNEPDGGFKAHVERSYDFDGLLNEGSLHYQLYDLTPLVLMARAAEHDGRPLFDYSAPNGNYLKKFLDAPIRIARPDLTVNSTGDGQPDPLVQFTALYSLANSHYKDPVFAHLVARRQPAPYRSWTVLTEALAVFSASPGAGKPPTPGPMTYKAGFAMLRQHATSAYYDPKNNARWALLSAQNHTYAHQNANQLDFQLGIGKYPLSAHASRGYLEYADDAQNGNYARARGYNILTLDSQVPLGAASFTSSGAAAKIVYCDKRSGPGSAVQVCEGAMTGGYVEGGSEKTSRLIMGVGGPEDGRGYFIDIARMKVGADKAGHRIGWIWHGPVAAKKENSSLVFSLPADTHNPTYQFVNEARAAKSTAEDFTVLWNTSDGAAGLMTHMLGGRRTEMSLGQGPEPAPFLYAERAFPAGEPAETAFIAVHEPYIGQTPALQVAGMLNNSHGVGVIVSGPKFRDIVLAAYDASAGIKGVNGANPNEYFFVKGKYGYARITKDAIEILGDQVTEIQFQARGIKRILYNGGAEIHFTSDAGYVHAWLGRR